MIGCNEDEKPRAERVSDADVTRLRQFCERDRNVCINNPTQACDAITRDLVYRVIEDLRATRDEVTAHEAMDESVDRATKKTMEMLGATPGDHLYGAAKRVLEERNAYRARLNRLEDAPMFGWGPAYGTWRCYKCGYTAYGQAPFADFPGGAVCDACHQNVENK